MKKSENKFALLRANRWRRRKKTKIDLIWVYVCNTSTSFEPLSVTFSSMFSCLSAKPSTVCSVHGQDCVSVCMWSDTNAMFIFVSDRCFFLRHAAGEIRHSHPNVCKYNKAQSEWSWRRIDWHEKNINVWFSWAVTTPFPFF